MDYSRLSKLPPELRNRIYDLVFTEETSSSSSTERLVDIVPHPTRSGAFEQYWETSRTLPVALTQTCRAIRKESSQMFYASLTFSFKTTTQAQRAQVGPFVIASNFLAHLESRNAAAVRKIVLGLPVKDGVLGYFSTIPAAVTYDAAVSALRTMLKASKKWTTELKMLAPKCEARIMALFRLMEQNGHYDLPLWFWLRGDEIIWRKTFEAIEVEAAVWEGLGLVRRVDFCRWFAGHVRRVQEECKEMSL